MKEVEINEANFLHIQDIKLEISVPNNKQELLIDSSIQLAKGDVIAGYFGGEVLLCIRTENGIKIGFVMDSRLAIVISGVLAKAACQGETKQ